jgi:hypothetical protein
MANFLIYDWPILPRICNYKGDPGNPLNIFFDLLFKHHNGKWFVSGFSIVYKMEIEPTKVRNKANSNGLPQSCCQVE